MWSISKTRAKSLNRDQPSLMLSRFMSSSRSWMQTKVGRCTGSHCQQRRIKAYTLPGQLGGRTMRTPLCNTSYTLDNSTPGYGDKPYVTTSHRSTPNAEKGEGGGGKGTLDRNSSWKTRMFFRSYGFELFIRIIGNTEFTNNKLSKWSQLLYISMEYCLIR